MWLRALKGSSIIYAFVRAKVIYVFANEIIILGVSVESSSTARGPGCATPGQKDESTSFSSSAQVAPGLLLKLEAVLFLPRVWSFYSFWSFLSVKWFEYLARGKKGPTVVCWVQLKPKNLRTHVSFLFSGKSSVFSQRSRSYRVGFCSSIALDLTGSLPAKRPKQRIHVWRVDLHYCSVKTIFWSGLLNLCVLLLSLARSITSSEQLSLKSANDVKGMQANLVMHS